jgi:formylglycine-generating enzyme required for sulfatase activity
VAVHDSSGVAIVDNRGPDRPAAWLLVQVGSLQTPDSALTAFPWGVAADPLAGRVYVADRFAPRVVVFDGSGEYQGEYGRRGGGPGEFTHPVALSVDPYGALTVWDAGRGVLSRWSSEGDLLNERRAPVAHWGPGVYEGRGRLVTVTSETSGAQMRQALVELGADEPVVLHSVPRDMVMMELPCIRQPASRLFAPSVIWTSSGEKVFVLNGTGYRIDEYTDGALVSSIRRPVAPIRVTAAMAADRVRLEYAGLMRMCDVTAERIVDAIGHEDLVAAIQWMTIDPAGRLWISRSPNGVEPSHIDILDPTGRYLGTLEARVLPVAFLSGSRFVGVSLDRETDTPSLSLYDLRPNATADGDARAGERAVWAPELRPDVREFRDCDGCPVMVEVPPGRYLMGAPPGEEPAAGNPRRPDWTEEAEQPQVEVEIAYRLAVGKYEVTFDEWDRCVAAGGCDYTPGDNGWGRGSHPVIHLARSDALHYVAWLAEVTGQPYRLPSEAEWEYAARAGTRTARYWGDAVGRGMTSCDGCGSQWDNRSTAPVGSFPSNQFGLHDMLGNVVEWVADCWHPNHLGNPGDGSARIETAQAWRAGTCVWPVRRGGAFDYFPWTVRSAARSYWRPGPWGERDGNYGFRVVRTVTDPPD